MHIIHEQEDILEILEQQDFECMNIYRKAITGKMVEFAVKTLSDLYLIQYVFRSRDL